MQDVLERHDELTVCTAELLVVCLRLQKRLFAFWTEMLGIWTTPMSSFYPKMRCSRVISCVPVIA